MVEKVFLHGAKILVLEDEPYVALDIAQAIEQAQGVVVGPFASVAAALESLRREAVDAAIVDYDVADGAVEPMLDSLTQSGSEILVLTAGELPADFARRRPGAVVFTRPSPSVRLWDRLLKMLDK